MTARTRRHAAIFAGWLLIAVYRVASSYMFASYHGKEMHWMPELVRGLAYAVIWTAMTSILFAFADRMSPERTAWFQLLFAIVPLLVVTAIVTIGIEATVTAIASHNPRPLETVIENWIVEMFHGVLLDAFVVLGLAVALRVRDEASRRKLQAAELETELANAQMQVLRSQIQPHFLFNTLQAVSSLIGRKPDDAKLMLVRLSDLLRMAMATAAEPLVPLRSELEFTERYLAIQQVRFSDRLAVDWFVDDHALDLPVPVFLLQPLVENSLKHGFSDSEEGGRIAVSATIGDGTLMLAVADDGAPADGSVAGEVRDGGIGLANIRSRLENLYGAAADLRLERRQPRGTIVTIAIPISAEVLEADDAVAISRNADVRRAPRTLQPATGRSIS